MRHETATAPGHALEFREPRSGCPDCGAFALHIPEWSDHRTAISCETCGKTVGTVGQLRDLLQAALEADDGAPG